MNKYRLKRLCAWSGIVSVILFFCGFVLSGFIPPPSPSLTPEQVATHYQQHANGIRGGMVLTMIAGMFMAPWVGEIAAQLRRMKGVPSGLCYGQVCAGTANAMFFFIPAVLFIVTAYRPERSLELTYLLNDLSWIMAVIPWPPAFMQSMIIGVAILADKSSSPIFPRWLAFVNVWVAIAYVPGGLLPFFKNGPFAWNGILVFWLAGSVFIVWFIAMTTMLLKAIDQQQEESRAAATQLQSARSRQGSV